MARPMADLPLFPSWAVGKQMKDASLSLKLPKFLVPREKLLTSIFPGTLLKQSLFQNALIPATFPFMDSFLAHLAVSLSQKTNTSLT